MRLIAKALHWAYTRLHFVPAGHARCWVYNRFEV